MMSAAPYVGHETFEAPSSSSTLMDCDWQMMVEEAVALYGYSYSEQDEHEGSNVGDTAQTLYQHEVMCDGENDASPQVSSSNYYPCLHLTMMYHENKWHHIATEIWARLNETVSLPFVTNFELDHVISKKDYLCPSPIANNGAVNSRRQSKAFPVYVKKSADLFSWVVSYLDANAPYHLQMVSDTQLLVTFTCQEHIHLLLELLKVFSSYECGDQGTASSTNDTAVNHDHYDGQSSAHHGSQHEEVVRTFHFDEAVRYPYDGSGSQHDDQACDIAAAEQEEPVTVSSVDASAARVVAVREKIAKYLSKILPFPMLQCWRLMLAKSSLPVPSSSPETVVYSTRWWSDIVAAHHVSDDWRPSVPVVNKRKSRQSRSTSRRQQQWAYDAAQPNDLSNSNAVEQELRSLMQFVYRKIKSTYSGRLVPWMYWDVPQLQSTSTLHLSSDESQQNVAAAQPRASTAFSSSSGYDTNLPGDDGAIQLPVEGVVVPASDNRSRVDSPLPYSATATTTDVPAHVTDNRSYKSTRSTVQDESSQQRTASFADVSESYQDRKHGDHDCAFATGSLADCSERARASRQLNKRRSANKPIGDSSDETPAPPKRRRQRAPNQYKSLARVSDKSASLLSDSSASTSASSAATSSTPRSSAYDVSCSSDGSSSEAISLTSSSSTSISLSMSAASDSTRLPVRREREVAHYSLGRKAPMACFVSPLLSSKSSSPRKSNFFDNRRFVK